MAPAPAARVRPARPEEDAAVARLLGEAFVGDPALGPLADGAADPAGVLARLVRLLMDTVFRPYGAVDVAVDEGDELLGAALWAEPGAWPPAEWANREHPAYVEALGDRLPLLWTGEDVSSHYHPHFAHWYLYTVAAATPGRGVGSALLAAGVARADAAGAACYLEATTGESSRLYERFGFATLGVIPSPFASGDSVGMWRPARTDAPAR